jgi:hypothetical protein
MTIPRRPISQMLPVAELTRIEEEENEKETV